MATTRSTKTVSKRAGSKRTTGLAEKVRQFLSLKGQAQTLDERLGTLKKELSGEVESHGYEDDKGSFWLDLPEAITVDGETYDKLKREKRTGFVMDEDAANAILKKRKLFKPVEEGGCLRTIVVLDEAEIRTQHFKGVLTDDDIDAIFKARVTWSFLPQKVK